MAAGTITITEERLANPQKITFAWTAGTAGEAGTASGTTTYPYTGNILKVVTIPGTVGTQPTDDYDLTLTDEDSIDTANGQLINRDDTNTELVSASLGAVVGDKLTLNVTNAGSGKTGTCIVYVGVMPDSAVDIDTENALFGSAGITTFPAAAVPADGVSLAEVIRSIWAGLMGTAAGENGITTYPAAAAAANDVSIAEVVRYIQATQIGTLTNSGGTATIGGILGDVANSTIAARLTTIAGHTIVMERSIVKSDGAVPLGDDNLFTIAGGPVLVTEFVGIVMTPIGADATTCQIQITTTAPAGTVNLSTAVNIETDAAGTSYTFTAATPGVLTPNTAGAIDQVPRIAWLCPIGTIKATFSAATTGLIMWYMVYKPLGPSSTVTAAA